MTKHISSKSICIRHYKPVPVIKPQLTSLIDVMTLLLVFLLHSFSPQGTPIVVPSDITLADSISNTHPSVSLILTVAQDSVLVNGKPVESIQNVSNSNTYIIDTVYKALTININSTHNTLISKRILIQCDKRVDFKVLKKLLFTCGKADLNTFSLLVVEKV